MRILCDSFLFYFEITSYWHVFITLFGKTVTIINFSKKSSNFLTFVFYSFSKHRRCDCANVVFFFHNQGEAGLAGDPGLPGPAGPRVGECGFPAFNPFTSDCTCTCSFEKVLNKFQAI